MKRQFLAPFIAALLASCSVVQTSPVAGRVRAHDHGGIGAGEGPAWKDGFLYFTDGTHINRMNAATGKTSVFREASGGANGLMFDRAGRLVACESSGRRVSRTEENGRIIALADRYEGHRFNSPNDVTQDSQGRIYFTDPRYGPRSDMEMRDAGGRLVEGVYRIDPAMDMHMPRPEKFGADEPDAFEKVTHIPGKVTRILSQPDVDRPNGILVSPGDRHLYICDNNNNTRGGSRRLLRFDLRTDGTVKPGSRKVIFDWKNGRGPDGMKMDTQGRLYVAAGVNKPNPNETDEFKAGCYIFSQSGRRISFVPTAPDEATNCAFGGVDLKTLYMTSGNHLWSVPLNTAGWKAGSR